MEQGCEHFERRHAGNIGDVGPQRGRYRYSAPTLLVKQTYLIFSEVSYLYTPTIGYVMGKSGVTLSDVAYTRPRQVPCVIYNGVPAATCPTP